MAVMFRQDRYRIVSILQELLFRLYFYHTVLGSCAAVLFRDRLLSCKKIAAFPCPRLFHASRGFSTAAVNTLRDLVDQLVKIGIPAVLHSLELIAGIRQGIQKRRCPHDVHFRCVHGLHQTAHLRISPDGHSCHDRYSLAGPGLTAPDMEHKRECMDQLDQRTGKAGGKSHPDDLIFS